MEQYSIYHNAKAVSRGGYKLQQLLSVDKANLAFKAISGCPFYSRTPLRSLGDYANEVGVAEILYKDESRRLNLDSFKALGGAYAVLRILQKELERLLGKPVPISEVAMGTHRQLTSKIVVTCATDGNHGRSVAAGAKAFGCACNIFIHEKVSQAREDAIKAFGAKVARVKGNYDDSVAIAKTCAEECGWLIVSDTSWSGYREIPLLIMQGYTVMVLEILAELRENGGEIPTHIFLQAGVGGLAAAVVAHFWEEFGDRAPIFVVVEPQRADCLYQSSIAGVPSKASGDLETAMAGLSCGEVSEVAWEILAPSVEYFMTIPDEPALDLMRSLARRREPIIAGESATAGLAGLCAVSRDAKLRKQMRLTADARVLVIGTEGATDPELYKMIVGAIPMESVQ